ncbi:MAG: hypothetical protein A2Z20_07875 [Bdellovibrionales bacterium RBG_16_40_8]|nr:MAG: hypothetical protein A2Z20_07875 [Bdellovibrionales bacterium RBG_16_40_8]
MAFHRENQTIYLITGKGGVGKSAIAAALAQKKASGGAKTLLVELGDQSYYKYIYNQEINYLPTQIKKNFSISLWSGETCLREYVLHLVKVKKIVDLFFNNRVMKTFIRAAPALKELAILGKITSGIRGWGPPLDFDVIVVDGFSTGHFIALLRAPIGMGEMIKSGPMGEQCRKIIEVLSSEKFCKYSIVTLPEELPVGETEELKKDLKATIGQSANIICNRIYPNPFSEDDLVQILSDEKSLSANSFAEHLNEIYTREAEQIVKLQEISNDITKLPFLFTADGQIVVDELEKILQ